MREGSESATCGLLDTSMGGLLHGTVYPLRGTDGSLRGTGGPDHGTSEPFLGTDDPDRGTGGSFHRTDDSFREGSGCPPGTSQLFRGANRPHRIAKNILTQAVPYNSPRT